MTWNFFECFGYKTRGSKICSKISLNEVNDDAELLKRIIAGDEIWVYGYDVKSNLI